MFWLFRGWNTKQREEITEKASGCDLSVCEMCEPLSAIIVIQELEKICLNSQMCLVSVEMVLIANSLIHCY